VPNVLANKPAAWFGSRVLHRLFRELIGCGVLVGLGALAACTALTGSSIASNTVSTFAPVTTVEVDSTTLFERLGCSNTAGVPYKYVATIYNFGSSSPLFITVTDCFTNAVFENMDTGASGQGDFTLNVDVFDLPTWNANQNIDFGNPENEPAIRAVANWTSNCSAHQTSNIQSLAVCDPL
jgi:TRAP-type uncharacterized transport system substrate-binding protein